MTENFQTGAPAPEGEASSSKPQLPDGLGFKLEDMAMLISMKHGSSLTLDDPVLMVASICNAFLGELENLHERHNEALGKILVGRTGEYVSAVKTAAEGFSESISSASVEGIRKIFDRQTEALQASIWNARWCALIAAVAALVNLYSLVGR